MSWDILVSYTFKAILLPPGINLVILIVALALFKRFQRSALAAIGIALFSLLIFSLPVVSNSLIAKLESSPPINSQQIKRFAAETEVKRAIVILSGGRVRSAPEYGQIDTVNAATLQRLQYAAWLQKRTGLPVLLSGGSVFNEATAEAVLMNQVMMANFAIAPRWIESQSKNTAENALFSAQILHSNDIEEILLITHSWHMPRAKRMFEKNKVKVIAAPTGFEYKPSITNRWVDYLPNSKALEQSSRALHEIVGQFWYDLRY